MARGPQNRAVLSRNRDLAQIAIVFVAYFLAGKLGQATTNIRSSNLGPVWPAYGIALAAILICGYRVWPAVAAATIVVALSSPVSAITAIGQAAGSTVAAVLGAFVLFRFADFDTTLSRLSDVLSLIALGGFGSALVSSSIGVLVLYLTHVRPYSGLGASWLIYWLGDATGVLLVTPLALRLRDFFNIGDRNRMAELAVLLILLVGTCVVVFGDIPIKLHAMAFAALPFIMWAAIRFGVGVTALSIFIVACIATVETALGSGPFASNTTFVNAVLLDAFFVILSVSGLSLAAAIAERERAKYEHEQAAARQAATEARLHADDELRESEERLRLATEVGKMYAYEWNVVTDEIVRSEGFTNIVGLMSESTWVTRKRFLTRVHPDDRAAFIAAVDNLTPQNPRTQISYRLFRDDGALIWLEMHGRGLFDTQGKMLRMIGMVADITERKQAEERLREYEKAVEGSEEMITVVDREYRYLIANRRFLKMRKLKREQVIGHSVHELMDETVFRKLVRPRIDECLQGNVVRFEMKFTYPDLGERDLLVSYFPIEDTDRIDRVAAVVQDITQRKQSEEALADMSRKLIEAQEQERTRIARELHDDISQRLALLASEIGISKHDPPDSSESISRLLGDLGERVVEISSEVQSISHQLHSSQLEYLGVVAAMRSFCREIAARQKVEIEFTHDDIPKPPYDVSLGLFRVLQEALHNGIKHSMARHFEVKLDCCGNELQLRVSDNGVGFDPDAAMSKGGLGLISMGERVRLMNGTLSIESKPTGGTVINVRVPFEPEILERAAGD